MQIKFNDVVLAGEWSESTDALTRQAVSVVQQVDYFRGSEPSWFERGNYKSSISFSTTRIFESVPKAELFFLEHLDNEGTSTAVELTGIAEFLCTDGAESFTRYARGRLTVNISAPIGCTIRTQYQLEYGRLLKTKPTD